MNISQKELKTLAKLCKLEFSDEEEEAFLPGFEEIIAFANRINTEVEGDTSTIREVSARTIKLKDLREDEVTPSLESEKVTSNVSSQDGYFHVRRVVK